MSGTVGGRRLAGVVSFTIDGDTWDSAGDVEYSTVTVVRETVKGQSRVEGYSEMPTQGFISAKLRDRHNVSVASLNGITNSTIIVVAANGKTVYGAGMWQVGEIAVATMDGSFSVRFESDNVQEQTI